MTEETGFDVHKEQEIFRVSKRWYWLWGSPCFLFNGHRQLLHRGWSGLKLATPLYLMLRLRMSGAVPPLLLIAWCLLNHTIKCLFLLYMCSISINLLIFQSAHLRHFNFFRCGAVIVGTPIIISYRFRLRNYSGYKIFMSSTRLTVLCYIVLCYIIKCSWMFWPIIRPSSGHSCT
jgi:hypothetical protein